MRALSPTLSPRAIADGDAAICLLLDTVKPMNETVRCKLQRRLAIDAGAATCCLLHIASGCKG